ncbi:hypothetical protein A5634_15690 [Mycobacterium asiaticum]|uniref:DUF732 domain-containing protein n=1 Tax=Mycobacterium asiaticum TaxID=1790 RepID=A0A1A3PBP8_MYCAS|nr:DUF732 domain-containing protein [Mycobacterium asiaticum]OBK30719.1 hypothetical protein A5634_15690 [Mycobacterium asiaticum]
MSDPEDSANLAWSRGSEVPDVRDNPVNGGGNLGGSQHAPPESAESDQSWATAWTRAGALLLICLAVAMVIVVAGWMLSKNKPADTAAEPTATTAKATASASATTTTITSTADQDSRYLAALNEKGIEFSNPTVAVHNGKTVCQNLVAGQTVQQITAQFRSDSPDFSAQADNFVAISVRAYCPQYSKLVAAY